MAKKTIEKYFINPELASKHSQLITLVGDEAVNLLGKDLEVKVKATKRNPETTRKVRGATQADLELLYENAEELGNMSRVIFKNETEVDSNSED